MSVMGWGKTRWWGVEMIRYAEVVYAILGALQGAMTKV